MTKTNKKHMRKMRLTLCIVCAFIFIIGCASTPKTPKTFDNAEILRSFEDNGYSLFIEAQEKFNNGKDPRELIPLFLKSYINSKGYWRNYGLWYIAMCYDKLNEPELAGRFLFEYLKLDCLTDDELQFNFEKNRHLFPTVADDEIFQGYIRQIDEYFSNEKRRRGEISYITAPMKIRYRTVLPDNFDENKSYNIAIFMHGSAGNLIGYLRLADTLRNSDIIYVAPQGPFPHEISQYHYEGKATFAWRIFDNDFEQENKGDEISGLVKNYIMTLVNELKSKYNTKGIYMTGHSQGGFTALDIGIENNTVIDGVISFGGGLSRGYRNPEALAGKNTFPVLIVHGTNDEVVKYVRATEAFEHLNNAGFDVTLHDHEKGHGLPTEEFEKAIQWLKNKEKQ